MGGLRGGPAEGDGREDGSGFGGMGGEGGVGGPCWRGCRKRRSRRRGRRGVRATGLTHAFLAAGVPAVVASLWAVSVPLGIAIRAGRASTHIYWTS